MTRDESSHERWPDPYRSVPRFVHYATAFAGADMVLCSCGQIMSATNIQTHIIDANKNWREAL